MSIRYIVCALSLCAAVAAGAPTGAQTPTVKELVARLDQAAGPFHTMSAKITRTKHTAVLNDNSTDSGTVYMKKLGTRGVQGVMDITSPDKKTYAFDGEKIEIYYPNMKTVEEYNAGGKGEELENFLMLGFGTSGTELEKNYTMRVGGTETVGGEKTTRLELEPKSAEAKKLVKEVYLWIPERGDHPIQEKISEPSGDYTLVTYANLQINPTLKPSDLKLNLPKGVKKVYPQK